MEGNYLIILKANNIKPIKQEIKSKTTQEPTRYQSHRQYQNYYKWHYKNQKHQQHLILKQKQILNNYSINIKKHYEQQV